MFSTGFNSWFWTWWAMSGNNVWNTNSQATKNTTKAPTKQEKFPWLNAQQIANIEKYTVNLTWAEKNQEQQKLYQAMIQAIDAENFNDNRMAVNNERFRNSLSKTDPRECKFDQSACRQSSLVDLVKSARNLKANTPEDTVMSMFMQEMDVKGIDMDKLNSYLDYWDETILYEAWLKTNQWGTKDLINQASNKSNWILPEKSEWWNPVWAVAETADNAANAFANKIMITWEWATENLKNRLENLSPEEIAKLREQYIGIINNLEEDDNYTFWEWIKDLGSALWHGTVWHLFWTEDKAYEAAARLMESNKKEWGWYVIDKNSRLNDESFLKWLIANETTLWESLIWADDILKWEHNPNVIRFFWNIPWSALKTFTATVRWMTNPYDTLKWLYNLAATEEWHKAILSRYWSWDALADAMNSDPVGVADDILAVAELWGSIVWGWLKLTWKITWNTSLTNAGNRVKANNFWSANDALAQKTVWGIYGGLDKLADMSNNSLVKWAVRYAEDTSSLSKLLENWKTDLKAIEESSFWQAIKNAKDDFVNKVVWIDEADRKFIQENKDLTNDVLNWKKNVDTILNDVKDKVSEKRLENTELWKEYGELRKNKSKVVDTTWITNDMKKALKENWITIDKDWNLKFKDLSKFNAKQIAALTDAWAELKKIESAKNINAWNVLDMRQKFDDKLNWDGKAMDLNWNLSAVDKATESLIREMRGVIDNRAKGSVVWLKELDAKYGDALADMAEIRKDRLNPDWTFKDNARSKLRNITKAWNEERLARLEKLMPWITNDLKALDVGLTIEKASKQGVWQYSKWVLAWSVPAWIANPVAWLAWLWLWILSTPKNYVKLIEYYPDIIAKLEAWNPLSDVDVAKLQSLASRIQDGIEIEE